VGRETVAAVTWDRVIEALTGRQQA